jgi:hypothetical protein
MGIKTWPPSVERRADGSTVIWAEIRPPQPREDYEKKALPLPKHVNLEGMQRSHSVGAGLGAEHAEGILYAPSEVNQKLQNRGIEQYLREIYRLSSSHGYRLMLKTTTFAHPGTNRLASIAYRLEVYDYKGEFWGIPFELSITVANAIKNPHVAVDISHVNRSMFR